MPYSFYILGYVFSFIGTVAIRFFYRLLQGLNVHLNHLSSSKGKENIMIIGAGEAGRALVTELDNSTNFKSRVVCVIDDNPAKRHKRLCGVPIVGDRYDIPDAVKRYNIDSIVFAIPTAAPAARKEILDICATTNCRVRVVPADCPGKSCAVDHF